MVVAITALSISLFGFWFTYWQPSFAGESFSLLLHVHAALWFGWFLLLLLQSGLIRSGNRRIHERVGIAAQSIHQLSL